MKAEKDYFINLIKILIYKHDKAILEKIDFDDENIYLDPLIFSYFNCKKYNFIPKEALEEILQGYFLERETIRLNHSFNKYGKAYIPRVGYFKKGETEPFEPVLVEGDFEIVKEIHPTQERYFIESYKGHVVNQNPDHSPVWKKHHKELFRAVNIIKKYLPNFYDQLIFANRKIYLHDNPRILNFTTVETLGMLYFYVVGDFNLIYFIEELIHEGSHNYLYYMVHNRRDYFKIDVDNLVMRDFTKQTWDYRTIYGAFHGLFTVTRRVECFDKLLTQNIFSGREKHELLGRLTDQFARFRTGLELLNLNKVYTEKGLELYNTLDTRCASILKKYATLTDVFDLRNRDLDFRYDDFCNLNPFEDFLKKDEEGVFNF